MAIVNRNCPRAAWKRRARNVVGLALWLAGGLVSAAMLARIETVTEYGEVEIVDREGNRHTVLGRRAIRRDANDQSGQRMLFREW